MIRCWLGALLLALVTTTAAAQHVDPTASAALAALPRPERVRRLAAATPKPSVSPAWESVRAAMRYRASQPWLPAAEFCFPSAFVPLHPAFQAYAQLEFTPGRPLLEAAIEGNIVAIDAVHGVTLMGDPTGIVKNNRIFTLPGAQWQARLYTSDPATVRIGNFIEAYGLWKAEVDEPV